MENLTLPPFLYKTKKVNGKPYIFDIVRKKFLVLTPEEWVRQHFVNLLITHCNYPKGRFAIETGLYYHSLHKRSDIMVLDEVGKPFLLVECKAPTVKITEEVFWQIARYNYILKPRYLAITNGLVHYFFEIGEKGDIVFLENVPTYINRNGSED